MSNKAINILVKFLLIFLGSFIVINTILLQIFDIGNYKKEIVLTYIIAFIISIIQFPEFLKNKLVMIPFYLMIVQLVYSLLRLYIL